MENYPPVPYLPANYLSVRVSIRCPVCDSTSCAVTLIREDGGARYLCGVSHVSRGTCVFRFTVRCVRSDEARHIQLFRLDVDGTPDIQHFATWSEVSSGHDGKNK